MEGIAAAGVIISAIELLVLYLAYQYGRAQWQPMFVLIVELLAYANQIISPGAEYSVMRLANGGTVEWLRYCGWLATCPVLLMFLVSMTTFAPRGTAQAPVRLGERWQSNS